eukprot:COSAG06_NODE_21914_length_741_cov_0.700935_1_plen_45_part_00
MSKACLDIISNKEIIALNQDPSVTRGELVYHLRVTIARIRTTPD